MKHIIQTPKAPQAIGAYSQAIKVDNTVYVSGQIPLMPETMQMAVGTTAQIHQVFKNLQAVIEAAGGQLKDIVKLNIYMTDLSNFAELNTIMSEYFIQPYPARAAIGVKSLPRDAEVEMDAIVVISD